MGRRGWVSAEDQAGDWWRLSVFDDGRVELPGWARGTSDTRAQFRQLGALLGGFVLLLVLARLVEDLSPVLSSVLLAVSIVPLVAGVVQGARFRDRDRAQARGDRDQARAAREAGREVRRRPGARLWTVAKSSRELADGLVGVRRIGAETVSRVDVVAPAEPSPSDPVVITVVLHDGHVLGYRTPDRTAVGLFAPWTR